MKSFKKGTALIAVLAFLISAILPVSSLAAADDWPADGFPDQELQDVWNSNTVNGSSVPGGGIAGLMYTSNLTYTLGATDVLSAKGSVLAAPGSNAAWVDYPAAVDNFHAELYGDAVSGFKVGTEPPSQWSDLTPLDIEWTAARTPADLAVQVNSETKYASYGWTADLDTSVLSKIAQASSKSISDLVGQHVWICFIGVYGDIDIPDADGGPFSDPWTPFLAWDITVSRDNNPQLCLGTPTSTNPTTGPYTNLVDTGTKAVNVTPATGIVKIGSGDDNAKKPAITPTLNVWNDAAFVDNTPKDVTYEWESLTTTYDAGKNGGLPYTEYSQTSGDTTWTCIAYIPDPGDSSEKIEIGRASVKVTVVNTALTVVAPVASPTAAVLIGAEPAMSVALAAQPSFASIAPSAVPSVAAAQGWTWSVEPSSPATTAGIKLSATSGAEITADITEPGTYTVTSTLASPGPGYAVANPSAPPSATVALTGYKAVLSAAATATAVDPGPLTYQVGGAATDLKNTAASPTTVDNVTFMADDGQAAGAGVTAFGTPFSSATYAWTLTGPDDSPVTMNVPNTAAAITKDQLSTVINKNNKPGKYTLSCTATVNGSTVTPDPIVINVMGADGTPQAAADPVSIALGQSTTLTAQVVSGSSPTSVPSGSTVEWTGTPDGAGLAETSGSEVTATPEEANSYEYTFTYQASAAPTATDAVPVTVDVYKGEITDADGTPVPEDPAKEITSTSDLPDLTLSWKDGEGAEASAPAGVKGYYWSVATGSDGSTVRAGWNATAPLAADSYKPLVEAATPKEIPAEGIPVVITCQPVTAASGTGAPTEEQYAGNAYTAKFTIVTELTPEDVVITVEGAGAQPVPPSGSEDAWGVTIPEDATEPITVTATPAGGEWTPAELPAGITKNDDGSLTVDPAALGEETVTLTYTTPNGTSVEVVIGKGSVTPPAELNVSVELNEAQVFVASLLPADLEQGMLLASSLPSVKAPAGTALSAQILIGDAAPVPVTLTAADATPDEDGNVTYTVSGAVPPLNLSASDNVRLVISAEGATFASTGTVKPAANETGSITFQYEVMMPQLAFDFGPDIPVVDA